MSASDGSGHLARGTDRGSHADRIGADDGRPTAVLFVCLGNICRSPAAEGVFRHLAAAAGLADRFVVDSAGTGDWHAGEPPTAQMRAVGAARGYTFTGRARQVVDADFDRFDLLVAMDRSNAANLVRRCPPAHRAKIRLLRDHDPAGGGDVPDPYGGDEATYAATLTIIERGCRGLLEALAGVGPD